MSEKIKRQLLIFIIAISALPALLALSMPQSVTLKSTALYLSGVLGYLGIVVLLWSYILGAKAVSSLVFRDIAPVLTIHKWLGKWGSLSIIIHPILVVIAYGESFFYGLIPHTETLFERHVTLGRISFVVVLAIWVSSALLRSKIAFRPWRYIHLLGYIALPFAFLHVPDVGSQFMGHAAVKVYFFSLAAAFAVFTVIRIRSLLDLDKVAYTVVSHQKLVSDDPEIWLLKVRPVAGHLALQKGQYVYLKDGHISEGHPFSVLNYDPVTNEISIAYRTFGRFTKELSRRQAGKVLYLSGPHGCFMEEMRHNNLPTIFVAGGIGVTPFVSSILGDDDREQWLFYSNRSRHSAMYIQKLRDKLQDRLVVNFTREDNPLSPNDIKGRLTAKHFSDRLVNPQRFQYFICGSKDMMKSIESELLSLGVPKSAIHSEAFGW